MFFSYHEFVKGLEIISSQYLRSQNGNIRGYKPSKEDILKESTNLQNTIIQGFNKAKTKSYFKLQKSVKQAKNKSSSNTLDNLSEEGQFNVKPGSKGYTKRKSCFSPIIEGSG